MSTVSNNDIARAIYLTSKDKDPLQQRLVFKKIINLLVRKHLLSKTPAILSALGKIINHEEGKTVVRVKSAQTLSEQAKSHLVQTFKKRYSAKEIILKEILDKNLLGGLRLEIDDEVIDLSIKNRITKLQEYLIRSHD